MRKRISNKNRKGFTMMEIMAVLIIVGLLSTVVTTTFLGKVKKAKVATTKTNLKKLHGAVQSFKMDTDRYPDEDEGLYALIEEPADVSGWDSEGYIDATSIPLDGWKHEFIYQLYPDSGKPFVIISYGADGEPGGEEGTEDADLYSTDAE